MQEVKSVLGKTEFLRRALLLKQRADLSRAHRFMTYEKIIAASQSLHSWINLFCVPGVKPCCSGPLMVSKWEELKQLVSGCTKAQTKIHEAYFILRIMQSCCNRAQG